MTGFSARAAYPDIAVAGIGGAVIPRLQPQNVTAVRTDLGIAQAAQGENVVGAPRLSCRARRNRRYEQCHELGFQTHSLAQASAPGSHFEGTALGHRSTRE